jgi:hypothetical protein
MLRRREMRAMNTLTDTQAERVLNLLREGKSLRAIERETGHRRETIGAYGRRAGLLTDRVTTIGAGRRPAAPEAMLRAA